MGELEKLGELDWQPYREVIERYENGPVPLEREMITPVGLTRSELLVKVHSAGL